MLCREKLAHQHNFKRGFCWKIRFKEDQLSMEIRALAWQGIYFFSSKA
jgi:hypothetical protein